MKKFMIPLVDIRVTIYVGEKEWDKFVKTAEDMGYASKDKECPFIGCGRTAGSVIWVYDTYDRNTLYHEVTHCLLNVMESCTPHEIEHEFSAFMGGFIYSRVEELFPVSEKRSVTKKEKA